MAGKMVEQKSQGTHKVGSEAEFTMENELVSLILRERSLVYAQKPWFQEKCRAAKLS